MNWGKGIITGMIVFMLFILGMCFYMLRMPADEYDHQYYEKGLNFDKDFNKERQVAKDHAQPLIEINDRVCTITFIKPAKGSVRFIRPSSEAMDKLFPLNTEGANKISMALQTLVTGRWRMIVEWTSDHKAYLYQREIDVK